MGNGAITVAARLPVVAGNDVKVESGMTSKPSNSQWCSLPGGGYHFVHQVIDVQEFQFDAGVIHCIRQVVSKCIAEVATALL